MLEGATLSFVCWLRPDVMLLEVVQHLAWHLFKGLSGKLHRIVCEVSIRHKLDNIGRHVLPEALRVQWSFVSVEYVHGGEVGTANTHNDDGKWEGGASDDLICRLFHVSDLAVGDYQQDIVLLVLLRHLHLLCHVIYLLDDWCKVGRATQTHIIDAADVGLDHSIKTVALGIKEVAIDGEAVTSSMRLDYSTVTKSGDLFVCVIVLKNIPDGLDSIKILIACQVTFVM